MSTRTGPPGDSNAGPVAGDRRTAERTSGEEFDCEPTPTVRQNAPGRTNLINVYAHGYLVVGTRGRCRLVLVVARCPFRGCGRPHVHNAATGFTSGKRTASCKGGGRYVVHVGTLEGEVAA